jgi:hypothetical protein
VAPLRLSRADFWVDHRRCHRQGWLAIMWLQQLLPAQDDVELIRRRLDVGALSGFSRRQQQPDGVVEVRIL